VLDAAARVFAETGYEAATTEAIARAAGTSIGSLYQFFPNKDALFDAISNRHLEKARVLFDAVLDGEALGLAWEELLDRAIDAFAQLDRDDPDFRAVWKNWHVAGQFFSAGQALNQEFARRIETILAVKAEGLSRARRAVVARVLVEVAAAMLFHAVRRDAASGKAIVKETKLVLARYLRPYTRAAGPSKKPPRV
jgi:AcrR family transcriptional regulator